MDERDRDRTTIAAYVAGNGTPEYRATVEAWITEHPDRIAELAKMRRLWEAIRINPNGYVDSESMWHQIAAHISERETPRFGVSRLPVRVRTVSQAVRSWGLSALLFGLVTIGFALALRRTSPTRSADRVYATAAGQRLSLTLPDGSHVTLAPKSKLTVSNNFGVDTRNVTLVGEAYFEIAKVTGAPFVVRTNTVHTRVLGTSFDVRRYAQDSVVQVAVVSGKVVTSGVSSSATLIAGSVGYVSDSTVTTETVDLAPYTDWTRGQLTFRDTPASVMLTTVGRWYGYNFHITDSTLANRRIIAMFRIDEPEKTLAMIERLLNVTMTFDGSTVTVRPRQLYPARNTTRRDDSVLFLSPREAGK